LDNNNVFKRVKKNLGFMILIQMSLIDFVNLIIWLKWKVSDNKKNKKKSANDFWKQYILVNVINTLFLKSLSDKQTLNDSKITL
jgi:transcription antitermination factor NusG